MNRHGWEFRNAERAIEPGAVLLGGRDQMLTEATWQNRIALAISHYSRIEPFLQEGQEGQEGYLSGRPRQSSRRLNASLGKLLLASGSAVLVKPLGCWRPSGKLVSCQATAPGHPRGRWRSAFMPWARVLPSSLTFGMPWLVRSR